MFIDKWELTPVDLWLNPDYTNSSTVCRFRKNDMVFKIEKKETDNFIILDYEVVFESVQTCNKVASASFTTEAKFTTTKDEKGSKMAVNHFLSQVFLKIQDILENHSNIPPLMIGTPHGILSAYDIRLLEDDVFSELKAQGFY
jgi:hypothetical protein